MNLKQQTEKFRYQLLSRLQMDCEYYLGNGNRHPKHLWSEDEKSHIKNMKTLYNSFNRNKKPEWISKKDIKNYEKQMTNTRSHFWTFWTMLLSH